MVGRNGDHHRFGILLQENACCVGYGGGGISAVGLQNDVLFGEFGQMLLHEFLVFCKRGHQDMVDFYTPGHSLEGVSDETFLLIPDAQELFRTVLPAEGPESGPNASGQDHTVIMVSHILV